MPSGKKKKRHKMSTHKRKKRLRKNRHKSKKKILVTPNGYNREQTCETVTPVTQVCSFVILTCIVISNRKSNCSDKRTRSRCTAQRGLYRPA